MTRALSSGIRSLWDEISLYGSFTNETLQATGSVRFVFGLDGDDDLHANPLGDSFLYGGDGSDYLISNVGADHLYGGDGFLDTADYRNSPGGVTVSLLTGSGSGGWAEGDQLYGIERVLGSAHDDRLFGSHKRDWLNGWAGNDLIYGRKGDDMIHGGRNDGSTYHGDILSGGAGADFFGFSGGWDSSFAAGVGVDVILDFDPASDDVIAFEHGPSQTNPNAKAFVGEATGWVNTFGSELWYQKTLDGVYGEVTNVHVRLQDVNGLNDYTSVMLVGHLDLHSSDFIW